MTHVTPEVWTLEIRLSGWRGDEYEWYRTVEILQDATLHDLHATIQRLVKFDDDHLYTFYVGQHWRQMGDELAEPAEPWGANEYEQIRLSDVYPLPPETTLYYWFDFGDDWIFEVRRRPGKKAPDGRAKYPRVVEQRGRNPQQYARRI